MKKLLSICFLSILLGLLSFSTRAQSNVGSSNNCASGFWIENLQPDPYPGIVNLPEGVTSTNVLSHTLGSAWYLPNGTYVGNAAGVQTGAIELYELHFCNTCGLDPKTQLSIDWLVVRDGDTINDHLSQYLEMGIYTYYGKLNVAGECQSIAWLGGIVPNEFGCCNSQSIGTGNPLLDEIQGNYGPCNDPANYPGAMQVEQGTPGSVLTQLGHVVPAAGQIGLYSQHLDYFYLDFFQQTRTIVTIKWKQPGDYKLIMRVRERNGGTPWNNMTWNQNEGTDFVGGHQSCCGRILAEDEISYPKFGEFSKEVCGNDVPYTFGRPAYDFNVTIPDTNVVFGQFVFAGTDCEYFQTDSIYDFHFFTRNNPDAIVKDTTICQCTPLTAQDIINMVGYDTVDFSVADTSYLQWLGYGGDPDTVEVGPGSISSGSIPVFMLWNNSYTQQIYTVEEIGRGQIASISFHHVSTSNDPVEEQVKIYLSNTEKSSFNNNSDWDLNEKTLVYEGTVTFGQTDEWVKFPLQTEFVYTGEKNLLVTVIGHNNEYHSHYFKCSYTSDYTTIYKRYDNETGFNEYTNENIVTALGSAFIDNMHNDLRLEVRPEAWLDTPVVPATDVEAADYEYVVRQVNEYANFEVFDGSQMDTIVCEGATKTFHIVIEPMVVTLPADAEYCVADFTDTTELSVVANHGDDLCATTTFWFGANGNEPDYTDTLFVGDNFVITHELLANYFNFEANQDGEVVFYAVAYNENLNCLGKIATPYTIIFHQTPVLAAVDSLTPAFLNCPGSEVEMQVAITNNPFQVDKPFAYHWTGVDEVTATVAHTETAVVAIPAEGHSNATSSYIPENSCYDYSYSQQIYKSNEVPSGTISAISFYPSSLASNPTRTFEIYMSTTNMDDLANAWDTEDNKQLVYSGTYTFQAGDWNRIELSNAFEYDNDNGNLLITCRDISGSWSCSNSFYVNTPSGSSAKLTRHVRQDGSAYELNYSGTPTGTQNYHNDIRFEMETVTYEEGHAPVGQPVVMDFTIPYDGYTNVLPLYAFSNHNYTQQLFTADEVSGGVEGTITKLTFDNLGYYDMSVKNDVSIYLGHTNKAEFLSVEDIVPMEDLQLVYHGDFNCLANQDKEIVLNTPFEFDGTSNLVVVFHDLSGDYENNGYYQYFGANQANNMAATYAYDDDNTIPELIGTGDSFAGSSIIDFRNNITFTVTVPSSDSTNLTHNNGYKELGMLCHSAYESTVFVVDNNGCKSNVVTFNYEVGDTLAPVVTPNNYSVSVNTCDSATLAAAAEQYIFNSIEALDEYLKNVEDAQENYGAYDNCAGTVAISHVDAFTPAGDGCEIKITRTYTLIDSCGNDTTFTHIFIGHDLDAPEFVDYVNPTAEFRPIRLLPIPAGDCKYNAPSLQAMKDKIRPYVTDACTDVDYMMNNIVFIWENLSDTIPVADAQDIFLRNNHLTISAYMHDKCNNWSDTVRVFFLDLPDKITIEENPVRPQTLCYGETTTLTFDPSTIVVDQNMGAFAPFTYTWSDTANGDVTFSDPHALSTTVTFNGAGDYYIVMTVTDTNDCVAVSEVRNIHVRPELKVTIEPVVYDGVSHEPFCPTYGNLTVKAYVEGEYVPAQTTYTWTGESVNVTSHKDTTWVTIVPEFCDTVYVPHVHVVDDHNCVADTFRNIYTAASQIVLGQLEDVVVPISDNCELIVPDFRNMMTPDMISDNCYGYSKIVENPNWYSQYPAYPYVFNTDSLLVTITIKNPCGDSAQTSLYVRKPSNYPTVTIDPTQAESCFADIAGTTFTASGTNLGLNPSYEWTILDGTTESDPISDNNKLIFPNDNWNPINEELTYTFKVTAFNNENGCDASATTQFTVHYQGDPIITQVWDNTMCTPGHYDGLIRVDTVPMFYTVILNGITVDYDSVIKINDNPNHAHSDWNSLDFDSLRSGLYQVTVINLFGCEMTKNVFVDNDNDVDFPDAIYDSTNQTECIANGTITITPEPLFTFSLMQGTELIGTGLYYDGLPAGTYTIVKTQIATGCTDETYVTLTNEAQEEVFTATHADRTDCQNANGSISVTATHAMWYRITRGNNIVVAPTSTCSDCQQLDGKKYVAVAAGTTYTFENLNAGSYHIIAYNPATGCFGYDDETIGWDTVHPHVTYIAEPNHYCANTEGIYDGKITVTPVSSSSVYNYSLRYVGNGGYDQGTLSSTTGVFENLYPNSYKNYTYTLTVTDPANNCTFSPDSPFRISDQTYIPSIDTLSTTPNTVCVPTDEHPYNGAVVLDVTTTPATAFNTYIQPYTVTVDGVAQEGTYTSANPSFGGFKEGSHTFKVVSNYKCQASKSFVVGKTEMPAMVLTQEPDHFCAPTVEKPGDGLITIHVPTSESNPGHEYTYRFFFYHQPGMEVPYNYPMTTTKYWLAHDKYLVEATEPATGCVVTDTITVAWDPYTVTFDTVTTPDEFCSATAGNGTITVINAQVSNPDVVGNFVYSIDGGTTYQTSNQFTGLNADPDNPYYITVKELTTACVADSKVVFISNDSCAPIIDSIYDNFGKGNEFHYCFGAEGMYLYGAAHDACDNTELEYHWNAPCADLSESDTYSIEVMTDHAVVGGCYYTLTVRNPLTECQTTRTVKVFVHPLPELYVTINGRRAEEHFLNEYCENVPLEIVVKNLNMEPLDIASIQWSQGYTATGVDTIHIVGTDYDIDTVTICVRANNIYNCGSRVVSFPVKFNRIITTNVPMTRCDGNCFITEPNGQTTEINKPAGVDYPYETVVTRYYVSSKGCDSIVNYQITLYGPAQLAPATIVPAAFCENDVKTLADFTPAASDIDWNGLEGEATWMAAEIAPTYTKVTSAAELTTGEYVITNAAGTKAMSNVATSNYYRGIDFDANDVPSNIVWNVIANADGTYSLSDGYGYLYITSNTGSAYISNSMAPATKFTAEFTNDGVKFVNDLHQNYALKYNGNGSNNRFAGYLKGEYSNMYYLAFYKKTNTYEEVLASTRVDYAFASTHNVKYVVTNDCGSDEAFATFNVSKAPVIDQFNVAADLCNNVETTIYYTVSSYGAPATATLKLGNDVVKTTTGIVGQQTIGYTFTPNYNTQNNKVFTLTLDNGVCDPDVETQTLTIAYTTKEINDKTYCQDASFEYEDFFTASEITTYGNTLQAYRKSGNTELTDGTTLTVNDNNMKVYFTFTDGCGNTVTTTDATITVNPKAQVSFNQLPHDFCLEGAADQLLTSLNKANAADSGWLYKASATATSYTTAANVNALVNAIKNMSEAQIAYHVVDANQCAYDTAYATVRILKPVQVSSDPITTCPNSEISQVINLAHATITNAGNYATSELNTTYTLVKANGTTIDVQSSSAVYTLATGDTLKVTVTPNIVPNCGVGIAKSGITVYTFDTIRPTFKVACDGQALKNFIATNPNYTGNMGIDTIYWTVVNNLQSTMVDPDTFIVSTNMNPKFRVVWNNACGQTYTSPVYNFNELNLINDKPEITLNDNFRVCEGGTISVAQTGFGVTYHGNADKYDTAWTINGVAFDFNTTLTVAQHNGKKLVVTLNDNNAACGPVTDTLTLIIDTIPVVTISGPERACVGELITFTATPAGYSSYSFTINGETFDAQTPNTYSTIASMESEEIGFEYTTASVSVKNSHNCVGTSSEVATVRVTNAPEFIFRTMDGEATHNYTSTVGQGLQYTWEVSTECFGPDKLVYVEYDIYYEDDMISNDSIGEYLATVTTIPTVGHNSQQYVTSNTFSWCANNGSPRSNTSYYNYAVANPSSISAGNHFPNTSLGLGTGHDVFDELWMSFLENCGQVTKTIVPFRRSGTYKIVYRLMATSHYQQLEYFYSPDCQPSSQLIPIGGHNALNAGAEITMLATDFVTIVVDGEDEVVSNNVAPEMAPAITMDEATVAPEMEVWPNPAPAITTTFKARVHNMSGEATVTISTLAGKQIYSNNMFIDSDNYYFEADVDNLSLGSYIMTVRTADAVISKKLVVMVSAK